MSGIITPILAYSTLFSHFLLILLILAFIFRKDWGRNIVYFVGKHALVLGFITGLSAIVGSLVYSGVIGYEPCVLCWWQRVFIYPSALLFLFALVKKDTRIFDYVMYLAIIAGIIGLYQSYVNLGGSSVLPCTAEGSLCSKVYVLEFGYITIPMMSLTISVFLIVISIFGKYYAQNNSNT